MFAMIVVTRTWRIESDGRRRCCRCRTAKKSSCSNRERRPRHCACSYQFCRCRVESKNTLDATPPGTARCRLALSLPDAPNRPPDILPARENSEAITLYIAACSVMAALKDKVPSGIPYWVYWAFVFLTPLLFLIIFAGRRRSDGLPAFPPFRAWPWFTICASTIAFGVWSLAIPGTPYLKGEVGGVLAAFLALFVSTFLTLLEP